MADIDKLQALLDSLGGSVADKMRLVSAARSGGKVEPHPSLAGLGPEDLAILDRLAWGALDREQFGPASAYLGGIFGVAPYEAAKGMAQSGVPGLSHIGQAALNHAGGSYEQSGQDAMAMNETTSPASLQNVLAFFRGIRERNEPKRMKLTQYRPNPRPSNNPSPLS